MPFQKGQSGNPGGRPKEAKFYAALDTALKDHKDGPDVRLRKVAENLVRAAEDSEQWAIREIADRLDGKPAQAITGDADNPLQAAMTVIVTGVPRPQDFLPVEGKADSE